MTKALEEVFRRPPDYLRPSRMLWPRPSRRGDRGGDRLG